MPPVGGRTHVVKPWLRVDTFVRIPGTDTGVQIMELNSNVQIGEPGMSDQQKGGQPVDR